MNRFSIRPQQQNPSKHLPAHFIATRNAEGEDCYFIIRASKRDYSKLIGQHHQLVDISNYGEIIASGFGHNPSNEVRDRLKREHGVILPQIL